MRVLLGLARRTRDGYVWCARRTWEPRHEQAPKNIPQTNCSIYVGLGVDKEGGHDHRGFRHRLLKVDDQVLGRVLLSNRSIAHQRAAATRSMFVLSSPRPPRRRRRTEETPLRRGGKCCPDPAAQLSRRATAQNTSFEWGPKSRSHCRSMPGTQDFNTAARSARGLPRSKQVYPAAQNVPQTTLLFDKPVRIPGRRARPPFQGRRIPPVAYGRPQYVGETNFISDLSASNYGWRNARAGDRT